MVQTSTGIFLSSSVTRPRGYLVSLALKQCFNATLCLFSQLVLTSCMYMPFNNS